MSSCARNTPRRGVRRKPLRLSLVCILASVLSACPHVVGQQAWHHEASPYRAVFEVASQPGHARAGVFAHVPVCGTGHPEGRDLVAFDVNGQPMELATLGEGRANCALAVVSPRPDKSRFFVYFSSRKSAPQSRRAFTPGLTVDIRRMPRGELKDWDAVAAAVRESERLAIMPIDTISLSYNPVDSSDAFAMVFDGYLSVAASGDNTFMLVSDDAGYLFVDDKLVVSRDGGHYAGDAVRGESKGTVALRKGYHPMRCVVADFGGDQMAVVARWITGKNKHVLKSDEFLRSGTAKLISVESRLEEGACPCFDYQIVSCMGLDGKHYTEATFRTLNGKPADWKFADGAEHTGSTFGRIFVGLDSQRVAVRQGRAQARGVVHFPQAVPPHRTPRNAHHFRHYSDLIEQQNMAGLDTSVLLDYRALLRYEELNKALVKLSPILLERKEVDTKLRTEILHEYVRCVSAQDAAEAEKGYRTLLKHTTDRQPWIALAREFAEFALHCKGDLELAEDMIDHMSKQLQTRNRTVATLRLQLAMRRLTADETTQEDARKWLAIVQSNPDSIGDPRTSAVRANAVHERYYDLLEGGFLSLAKEKLWEWEDIATTDWSNGNLFLARSRFWQKMGWLNGALAELDAAIVLLPMLPNLPDVEFERASIFEQNGQRPKAIEIYDRISREYPNHPLAAVAAKKSGK